MDAGVDWITATSGDSSLTEKLRFRAASWVKQESARGCEIAPWRQYGYEGLACGSVQFGERTDSGIVRLGGAVAWQHWREVYRLSTNVSRIDVQVTIRHSGPSTSTISAHYKAAMRARKRGLVRRAVDLYRGSDGSATVYFGKRQSERFGRIYEKGRQSRLDHYENAVRYEVEFKDVQANHIAKTLAWSTEEKALVVRLVADYFNEARAWSSCVELGQSTTVDAAPRPERQSSIEWLRYQVAPAVTRLIEQGHLDQVVQALGLAPFVSVNQCSSDQGERSQRRSA